MGKYSDLTGDIEGVKADALVSIANELAEQNRLERWKINNGCYEAIPLKNNQMRDEA